jgi:hypothetical protein
LMDSVLYKKSHSIGLFNVVYVDYQII